MRILQDCPDWRDQYIMDIHAAKDELKNNNFTVKSKNIVLELYSLPPRERQTYFAQLVFEHEIYKMIYAKPVQRSVWFSDPLNNYTFAEAVRFKDDPKRQGRIFCGTKLVSKTAAFRLQDMVMRISDNQPESAVRPDSKCGFTSIRVFKEGRVGSEYLFTDAALLRFCSGVDVKEAIHYLNDLQTKIEEIIGIGENNPDIKELL